MLAPDSRVLLIDQLTPPPGFQLDAAVATTFTLDLTATLLPALAFSGFHLAGGTSDPIATLESIRSTAGRIDVFCQAGAITVPERAPDLLAFLEPMVHAVRAPGAGLFHPKIWFIRYVDEAGAPAYRLLVLTRNLTLDSSWDLAVRLDSAGLAERVRDESAALGDLIASLPQRALQSVSDQRRTRILALAEEARRVEWEVPAGVGSVHLHHLDQGRALTMDLRGSRHLVVSPFVDASGLSKVSEKGPIEILSRGEELDKLEAGVTTRLSARVLDDLAVVQQVEGSRLGGQLHAKMYVVEQSSNWSRSHVFIGSANATGAAFSINTEFMVELRGHRKLLGIDRFLGGDGAFLAVTEPYTPSGTSEEDPADALQRELDNAVRRVASVRYAIEVQTGSESTPGVHELHLRSDRALPLEPEWHATVELLTLPDHAAVAPPGLPFQAVVPDVATGEITPFLAIRVHGPAGRSGSTVVVADLINAPADRLDVVLARQIDTPEKFLRFLFFLLSLGNPAALAAYGASQAAGKNGAGATPFGSGGGGVLEMVLAAIATRPEALADLDVLIRRLEATEDGRRSLPDGFLTFWAEVRLATETSQEVSA